MELTGFFLYVTVKASEKSKEKEADCQTQSPELISTDLTHRLEEKYMKHGVHPWVTSYFNLVKITFMFGVGLFF